MLAVLDKEAFQALECSLAPGEADTVDGEIVDETRVEMVLGVAGARLRHTRRGLLGNPELGAEGTDELGEHRLVAQIAGDLRKTGQELLDGYRARCYAHPAFEVARETDLHAVHLQARLYVPNLVGGNVVIMVLGTEGFLKACGGDAINLGGVRFGLWERSLLFEFLLHH